MSFPEYVWTITQALWAPSLVTAAIIMAVGFVSIWAALSCCHWFLRAVVVALVVAPTAAIPGHDVILVFMLQSLLMIVGIKVYVAVRTAFPKPTAATDSQPETKAEAGRARGPCPSRRGYPQFSLLDLMLAVLVAAVICAVVAQTPSSLWVEWANILMIAIVFSIMTAIMGPPLPFMSSGHGPEWLVGKPIRGKKDLIYRLGVSPTLLLLVLLILPAPRAVIYHKAINPIPLPPVTLPDPNGYDDLLRTGGMLLDLGVPDPHTATLKQLADFVQGNPEVLDAIRLGLSCESLVPLTYTLADHNRPTCTRLRCVAWSLAAEGQLAEAEGQIADAVTSYLDILRVAEASSRGGLTTDVACGDAWEYLGVNRLARIVESLPANEARRVIKALEAMDARREPVEAIATRERLWWHHTGGRMGRAIEAINIITLPGDDMVEWLPHSRMHHQARLRLLVCELALHCYRLDHDRLPDKLADLVPKYLYAVRIDPYSQKPIVFRPDSTGPILYSVGPNGRDDGGKPQDRVSYEPISPGDVLLIEPEVADGDSPEALAK